MDRRSVVRRLLGGAILPWRKFTVSEGTRRHPEEQPTFDGHGLGALKQPKDPRDHLYSDYLKDHPERPRKKKKPPSGRVLVAMDAKVDIYNQESLGSCTAQEACAHYQILQAVEGLPIVSPSRLEVYYNARSDLGNRFIPIDSGATGRGSAKVLNHIGACPEHLWPYDVSRFAEEPPAACKAVAGDHQLIQYLAIPEQSRDTLDLLRTSLAAGYPVGFSFAVYSNFEPDHDGVIPMPAGAIRGGHRMLLIGYDTNLGLFKARNSWAGDWGPINGRCWFHEDNVIQGFGDFWTFRLVE